MEHKTATNHNLCASSPLTNIPDCNCRSSMEGKGQPICMSHYEQHQQFAVLNEEISCFMCYKRFCKVRVSWMF